METGMRPYELTAKNALDRIRAGQMTPKDLIDSCISRIEKVEPSVRAWCYFDKRIVYEQLEEVQKMRGKLFDDALFGIPVGVKDIFNTKDMPTTMGSPIWEGFTPGNDARVVHNIRVEGGIVMGKTVTAEFAVHYPGPTNNPHNTAYTPGTSSSGSAAAVASGMVPLAIGTQTAGSIIRPASYCGVYGYKPSFGLLPRTGILKTVDPLDHVGFFSRGVDDLEILLSALRVNGLNYPYVHRFLEDKDRQTKKKGDLWKIAFVRTYVWGEAERYTQKSIEGFAASVARIKGVSLTEAELPSEFNETHDIHAAIYNKALSYYFKEEREKYPDKVSDVFRRMTEEGSKLSVEDYRKNLERQAGLTIALDEFLSHYDAIITISTSGEALPKELYLQEKRDTSLIWTTCRVPSITVPLFKGPAGLPFGLQVVARRYNDYRLLSLLKFLQTSGAIADAGIAEPAAGIKDAVLAK
jgi:Asp-tRNA(Asn)/Glu-tRNA(Gln) amidotransferase A subunit family amidase